MPRDNLMALISILSNVDFNYANNDTTNAIDDLEFLAIMLNGLSWKSTDHPTHVNYFTHFEFLHLVFQLKIT